VPRRSTVGPIDATIRTESLTKICEGPPEGPPGVSHGPRPAVDGLDLMFVFTYVFPKIGQGIGSAGGEGQEGAFNTLLVLGASLGLTVGTRVQPRQVALVFSLLVLPMTFLGAVYYPWQGLEPLPWLKWGVIVNPLVYLSEGVRLGLTGDTVPYMNGVVIYLACIGFTAVLGWVGIEGFRRRVLA
jgi:ABC-2 type transporter